MAYQAINDILQRHDSDVEAAGAHGIASALLCVDQNAQIHGWLDELVADTDDLSGEELQTLADLFERTRKVIQPESAGFEFDVLLPDTEDLSDNALALSLWCEGFLWGIGYTQSQAHWSGEIQAILHDMIEFTKLDVEIAKDSEEEQEAFMQIHEYLRAAVLLIRDELLAATPTQYH